MAAMAKNTRQQSEDDKHKDPKAKMEGWEPSPLPPIAADGGFAADPGVGNMPVIPDWTPDNTMCLRGPCKHYWHLVTMTEAGNPDGTWEALGIKEPRQHDHTCLVQLGLETDLGENCVHKCSKWEPMTALEKATRQAGRDEYFAQHPEHLEGAPSELPPLDLDDEENVTNDGNREDDDTDSGISGVESLSADQPGETGEVD